MQAASADAGRAGARLQRNEGFVNLSECRVGLYRRRSCQVYSKILISSIFRDQQYDFIISLIVQKLATKIGETSHDSEPLR